MATIWKYCNVYPTAIMAEDVVVGSFTEIGDGVVVGTGTRICQKGA